MTLAANRAPDGDRRHPSGTRFAPCGGMRPCDRPELRRPPSLAELAAGLLGGALLAAGPSDRAGRWPRGLGLALVGFALVPVAMHRIREIGERRSRVSKRATIEIEQNVADVFAFFNDFENFPRVVGSLRSVIDHQDGRSHWEAYTHAGEVVAWDTVITKYVPRSVLAWESTPDSDVIMNILLRFTGVTPTRTRIDADIDCCLARPSLAAAIRSLLGSPLEERIRNDLSHTRFYLESLPARRSARRGAG